MSTTTLTAPFTSATGALTSPETMLNALLGETKGNPASQLFVCKPYLNGEPLHTKLDIGTAKPFLVPNVMIGGNAAAFKYLNLVLRDALEIGEYPSYPLHYSITGKGIHNFPKEESATKAEPIKVVLSAKAQAALAKVKVNLKAANPENIGNLNVTRVTGNGKQYAVGFIKKEGNETTLHILETILPELDLTWHLELTTAGKLWFDQVK